jgi:CPA2 family monovalent cation:H+ antiporter-2
MEHGITFLHDLAIVLIVGGITTILFHKLKQPVVLGYMLAGLLIGPHTPPFPLIQDEHTVKTLAEMGVVLLMFRMGLHFSLRKLVAVGVTAFIAASFEIIAMLLLGYGAGQLFGWNTMDSVFLGAILSISSTTIIVKTLVDLKMIEERFAELIFGILIVEDILAIAMLAVLSSFATSGTFDLSMLGDISLRLVIFLAVVFVIGLIAVPRILRFVAGFRDAEMLLVVSLGLCFGVSLLAVKLGYSVALGAFLIGAIMAESREAGLIEKVIAPVRDMFSAVFFVAVGMLIDPHLLIQYAWPILLISLIVIVGKIIACTAGAFLAGNDAKTSTKVGMGLAQIGEFSFIIAQLGENLSVTSTFIYPIAVTVSVITTITTPYLIKNADWVVAWVGRKTPPSVRGTANAYQGWVQKIRAGNAARDPLITEFRHAAAWIGLDLLLIAAVFIVAASAAIHFEGSTVSILGWTDAGTRGLIWLAATICILPLIVGALRKFWRMATLLADQTVSQNGKEGDRSRVKRFFSLSLFLMGTLAILTLCLLMGATILPGSKALLFLLPGLFLVGIFAQKRLNAIYSGGLEMLTKTFSAPTTPHLHEELDGSATLSKAGLRHIDIAATHFAAGKLIRHLHLRSKTGALIIVIVRGEDRILSPGPDEEILAGDKLLVLGDDQSLARAHELITAP